MNSSQIQPRTNSTSNVTKTFQALDSVKPVPTALPVLTAGGVRIPMVGTIAYHEALGFCTVVSRTHETLRLSFTEVELDGADDVTLRDGSVVSRADWLMRASEVSLSSAITETAVLDSRYNALDVAVSTGDGSEWRAGDPFAGATALIKQLTESIEERIKEPNQMIITINGAERCGWQFDEYASHVPMAKAMFKSEKKAFVEAPARVAVDESDDWFQDELDDCDWSGDRA